MQRNARAADIQQAQWKRNQAPSRQFSLLLFISWYSTSRAVTKKTENEMLEELFFLSNPVAAASPNPEETERPDALMGMGRSLI